MAEDVTIGEVLYGKRFAVVVKGISDSAITAELTACIPSTGDSEPPKGILEKSADGRRWWIKWDHNETKEVVCTLAQFSHKPEPIPEILLFEHEHVIQAKPLSRSLFEHEVQAKPITRH